MLILFYEVCFLVSRNCRIWDVLAQNLAISDRAVKPKSRVPEQDDLLRPRLTDMIDMRDELVKLAALIDWEFFETEWAGFFPSHICSDDPQGGLRRRQAVDAGLPL